ncbi:uncharacterized protein LOC112982371 [Dromaius novaehollandiae]|uniref:uncharacterized protein LOC112982371 n=1 Tax=Dromaius novaehollandiae TaxID=8790 RepID=UPI00311FADFE
MKEGERYSDRRSQHRTKSSMKERYLQSKRTLQEEQLIKRAEREPLLTRYLHLLEAQKSSPSKSHKSNALIPRCTNCLRKDIQVLQDFIRVHESSQDVVAREEVVIVSEDTEVCKPMPPKRGKLSEEVAQMQQHRRPPASRDSPSAQHIYNRESLGGRATSEFSDRVTEPNNMYHLAEDFSMKVYCFTAFHLAVSVGLLCWTRVLWKLQKYLWLFLTPIVAITILHTICNKMFLEDATYTFLGTVIGSMILGIISESHDTMTLMQVGGITAFATLLLIVLALMTKKTLTSMNISIVSSILLIIGAVVHILINSSKFQVIYAAFGTLVFATDLMKTVAELERQPTEDHASMNYTLTARTLYIHIAMLFFFTLLLVDDKPLHSLLSFVY